MSIKIHEAYRVPVARLNEALDFWHESLMDHALEFLHGGAERKRNDPHFKEYSYIHELLDEISQHRDYEGMGYNWIEACVGVWVYKKHAYMIPFVSGSGVPRYWDKVPDYFEDYRYYNNTDKPSDITTRQWRTRRKTWDKVYLDDWYVAHPRRLNFEIVDPYTIEGRVKVLLAYRSKYLQNSEG